MAKAYNFGWYHDPTEVRRVMATLPYPDFATYGGALAGTGAGKDVFLWKALEEMNGGQYPYEPRQEIGCCVSRGYASGVRHLAAVQAAIKGEDFLEKQISHEFIYWIARIDIGGGRLGNEDGATGAWAAKAVNTVGAVSQEDVGFPYSDAKAKEWGYRGGPPELKTKAAGHKVKTVSLVTTYDQLCDALANGFPVPVCSNQGFTMTRDSDGFCSPQGSWSHCMLFIGCRVTGRAGACILQSWGEGVPSGPTSLGQPNNSFWVEPDTVNSMLGMQDSFLLSAYDGYVGPTPVPKRWTMAGWA